MFLRAAMFAPVGTGCGNGPAETQAEPQPFNGVYALSVMADTQTGLPACNAALRGVIGFVKASAALEYCDGARWIAIPCAVPGTVATSQSFVLRPAFTISAALAFVAEAPIIRHPPASVH